MRVCFTPRVQAKTYDDDEPSSYTEAMSTPDAAQWRAAIDSELDSLKRTGTWTLTPLAAGRQAIGSRWVLRIKRKADGTVDKYKARLVAKGYAQKAGTDYDETFAPVAKFTSIRMLLALAAHHDFEIHQMDVKTAFLNGDLDVDIYMEQPEGYSTSAPGDQRLVCKLQKALYGLKQAGRARNEKMVDALLQLHFTPLDSDSCVFVHRGDSYVMFIALYVDDLLIFSSSLPRLIHLKRKLSELFEMTDMGEAHYILGLTITRDRSARQLCLSQQEYVRRVVERYGMTKCNPASTPLTTGTVLSKHNCPSTPPATPVTIHGHTYASVVGALMYAMLGTRPDLAYSVGCLSRFNSNPGAPHVAALKHVLRYLAGTTEPQRPSCSIRRVRLLRFRLRRMCGRTAFRGWLGVHGCRGSHQLAVAEAEERGAVRRGRVHGGLCSVQRGSMATCDAGAGGRVHCSPNGHSHGQSGCHGAGQESQPSSTLKAHRCPLPLRTATGGGACHPARLRRHYTSSG